MKIKIISLLITLFVFNINVSEASFKKNFSSNVFQIEKKYLIYKNIYKPRKRKIIKK
jgi:hypothetical protein